MGGIRGVIVLGAAFLPCLGLIRLIRVFGGNRSGYGFLILRLFAAGFAAPAAAVFLEWALIPLTGFLPEGLVPAARAFLGIALPEEALKTAAVVWVCRRRDFGCLMDGAVYGVSAAMGFALLENILYLAGADEPTASALHRGLTAVPLHALTGGFMGLALARVRIESRGSLSGALTRAVMMHGAYDWFLIDPGLPSVLILALLPIGWVVLFAALVRARRADKDSGRPAGAGVSVQEKRSGRITN